MRYSLTALTPLLVGDGQKLSPIDYMVWKDQVNVLDQRRIFRLLARGPRLEGYLTQIRKAEKLDFASWGGFAQNFAGRRIPFEHASLPSYWEQARAENLHIPTFCAGSVGPYLPGSAVKGALRTTVVAARWNAGVLKELASRMEGDRPLRKPGEAAESMTGGSRGSDPLRVVAAGDSAAVPFTSFKVYLLRLAALEGRENQLSLSWKPSLRGPGAGANPAGAAPSFAEMATPGTVFSGIWQEGRHLARPDLARALHWGDRASSSPFFRAANEHAARLLEIHRQFAETARLPHLVHGLTALQEHLARIRDQPGACLLNVGWGGGLLSKTGFPDTGNEDYRRILRQTPWYSRAIRTGLPFPKTRRVVFLQDQPAALPGWVSLELTAD